jgi:hypothetical protein
MTWGWEVEGTGSGFVQWRALVLAVLNHLIQLSESQSVGRYIDVVSPYQLHSVIYRSVGLFNKVNPR